MDDYPPATVVPIFHAVLTPGFSKSCVPDGKGKTVQAAWFLKNHRATCMACSGRFPLVGRIG
jgi:hypothetical protein